MTKNCKIMFKKMLSVLFIIKGKLFTVTHFCFFRFLSRFETFWNFIFFRDYAWVNFGFGSYFKLVFPTMFQMIKFNFIFWGFCWFVGCWKMSCSNINESAIGLILIQTYLLTYILELLVLPFQQRIHPIKYHLLLLFLMNCFQHFLG